MRVLAQDVRVVSAAVSVGGTESDIIHMESAESPVDGASDLWWCGGGTRADDSGVMPVELLGESVNAATVAASAAMETGVARMATLVAIFAACRRHAGVVTARGADSAWMRAAVSDIRDTDTLDDSNMRV